MTGGWRAFARGRRPLLTTIVDLYGGSRAAVRIIPVESRWPEAEGTDRLALPVWFAALTLASASGPVSARIRHRVMELAAAIAVEDDSADGGVTWSEAVAGRRLIRPDGPGQPQIVVTLGRTASRLAPAVDGSAPSPTSLAAAAAAAAGVALIDCDHMERLSVALALEGLLIRHRETRRATWSATEAVGASLHYALYRLEDVDRPIPSDLRLATSTWEMAPG